MSDIEASGEATETVRPEDALAEAVQKTQRADAALAAERSRSEALQRERDEARTHAATAGAEAVSSRDRSIDSSIASHTTAIEAAKRDIVAAQSANDAVATADAYDRLADSRAKLNTLQGQKEWLAAERTRVAAAPRQQQADATKVRVSTPGGAMEVDPADKQWMDANPRFYDDGDYYNHAIGAHGRIVADGVRPGTPAYYRGLSEAMKKFESFEAFERGEEQPARGGQAVNTQRRGSSAAATAAPVSRQLGDYGRRNGGGDERSIAQHLGVTPADLKDFAKIAGYRDKKGEPGSGYARYLSDQQEIRDIARSGGDTGLKVEQNYR